jgi:hypothetical protein
MTKYFVKKKTLERYKRVFDYCTIPSNLPETIPLNTRKDIQELEKIGIELPTAEHLIRVAGRLPEKWFDSNGNEKTDAPEYIAQALGSKYESWLLKKLKESVPILIKMRKSGKLARIRDKSAA